LFKLIVAACIITTVFITVKFIYLYYHIKQKKRMQRIITPSERIQYRNWVIIFIVTLTAVFIGLGSAFISYL